MLAQTRFLFDGVGASFPLILPMERVTGRGEVAWSCIRMRDRVIPLASDRPQKGATWLLSSRPGTPPAQIALGPTRPGGTLIALSVSRVRAVMAGYSLVCVMSVEIQLFYLLSEVNRVTEADTSGTLSVSDS